MNMRLSEVSVLAALASGIACNVLGAQAVEAPIELQWHQLVPPAPPTPQKSFSTDNGPVGLGNLGGPDGAHPVPPPLPEGRWLSKPARKDAMPSPLVETLRGKRVHIGCYVVPLSFDATRVTDFL